MGLSFTVEVLDEHEEPIVGAEVTAYLHEDDTISDILTGGRLVECTDDDGQAHFECGFDEHDSVVLHCHGEEFGPYEIDDGDAFTINVSRSS